MHLVSALLEETRALRFRATQKNTLAIFNWHQVTPAFDPARHHPHTWTALANFETAIDDVAESHSIMPLDAALAALDGGFLRGRCAALTFDDGDRSIADYVAPLLLRRGLPATFFINSAYLRGDRTYWFPVLAYAGHLLPAAIKQHGKALRQTGDTAFYARYREALEQYAAAVPNLADRFVTANWLSRLDGEQFAIGAHGHEHQRYAMMSEHWQRRDIAANVMALRDFRAFRPVFAPPFGKPIDVSPDLFRIAGEARLKIVLASGGINTRSAQSYDRIPADNVIIKRALTRAMAANGRRAAAAAL
ncbi:MAG: polysaccharide deacetylase family protein [Pseudolabrys sp.]|nr:polysaccharide deacetylase family protein [Pseudolabrys sp.]